MFSFRFWTRGWEWSHLGYNYLWMDTSDSSFVYSPSGKKWLYDEYATGVGLSFEIEKVLESKKTSFQDIKIVKSKALGNVLLLNNWIYRAEDGGSVMPEMIVHVPMNTRGKKRRALLIGGGDGFSLTEIVKYPEIEEIDMVDIDSDVISLCKKHFSSTKPGFADNRVKITISDGAEFLKSQNDSKYDLILVTGTEAYDISGKPGISYSLFQDSFYSLCKSKLSPDGIILTDGQNGYYGGEFYQSIVKGLQKYFSIVKTYTVTSKFIPGGMYVINIGSKKFDPENDIRQNSPTRLVYYTPKLHQSSFSIPKFLQ